MDQPDYPHLPALDDAADRINVLGPSDPLFSGAGIDVDANAVEVYRAAPAGTTPAAAVDQAYRGSLAPGQVLRYKFALLTMKQVNQAIDILRDNAPAWRAAGTIVTHAGLPAMDQPFTIDYTGAPPSASMIALFDRVGPGLVVFKPGGGVDSLGRVNDTSPFWGGAGVHGPGPHPHPHPHPHPLSGLKTSVTDQSRDVGDTSG